MDCLDFSFDTDGVCWFDDTMVVDSAGIVHAKKGLFSPLQSSTKKTDSKQLLASWKKKNAADKGTKNLLQHFDSTFIATEDGVVEPRSAFGADLKNAATPSSPLQKRKQMLLKKKQKLANSDKKKHVLEIDENNCMLLSKTAMVGTEKGVFSFSAPCTPKNTHALKKRHRLMLINKRAEKAAKCLPNKVLAVDNSGKVVVEKIYAKVAVDSINLVCEKKVGEQKLRMMKGEVQNELLAKLALRSLKKNAVLEVIAKKKQKGLKKAMHQELLCKMMVKDLKQDVHSELLEKDRVKNLKENVHEELLKTLEKKRAEKKAAELAKLRRGRDRVLQQKKKRAFMGFTSNAKNVHQRRLCFRKWSDQKQMSVNDEKRSEFRRQKNKVMARAILTIWRAMNDEHKAFSTRLMVDSHGVVHQEEVLIQDHLVTTVEEDADGNCVATSQFVPPSRVSNSWVKL